MSSSRSANSAVADASTRASETTQRILTVAEELFAECGFEAVSMNAVAEKAGVSKANIFHHFTSKRELYLAVLHNACRHAAERLHDLERHEGTFSQRLTAYSTDFLKDILERDSLHRLMLRELLDDDGGRTAKELAERVFGERFARLVSIFRAGQAEGALRADFDPAMAAIMLIGMNVFYLQSHKVFKHLPDARAVAEPKRYAALLNQILLHGILAEPE